jgi:uncharacterized protein (TIGR02271 family)
VANNPPVHVLSRDDGWAVVRGDEDRAISIHPTQAEAAEAGREIAREDGTEFLLHARDGRIRDRRDYGEAPVRPEEDPAEAGVLGSATRATDEVVGLASGVLGGTVEGLGGAARGIMPADGRAHDAPDRGSDDTNEEAGGLVYEERYADYEVHDRVGERLGHVDALFLDEDDRPEYLGVKMGLLGTRSTLIPWAAVTRADEESGRLEVAVDKETAANGPAFADDEEITPELERQIHSHYRLERGTEERGAEDRGAYGGSSTDVGQTGTVAGPGGLGPTTGGTESAPATQDEIRVQRSEEELVAGTRQREAGAMRIRKRVRTDRERVEVPVRREEVRVERVPVSEGTEGAEIGEDEIVVPVTETEVVVSKRAVVKEELRVRKDVVEGTEVVEEDVRREEIDIEDDTNPRREG